MVPTLLTVCPKLNYKTEHFISGKKHYQLHSPTTLLRWKPALTAPKFAVERNGMGGGGSFQGEGLVIWAGSGDSEKLIK